MGLHKRCFYTQRIIHSGVVGWSVHTSFMSIIDSRFCKPQTVFYGQGRWTILRDSFWNLNFPKEIRSKERTGGLERWRDTSRTQQHDSTQCLQYTRLKHWRVQGSYCWSSFCWPNPSSYSIYKHQGQRYLADSTVYLNISRAWPIQGQRSWNNNHRFIKNKIMIIINKNWKWRSTSTTNYFVR